MSAPRKTAGKGQDLRLYVDSRGQLWEYKDAEISKAATTPEQIGESEAVRTAETVRVTGTHENAAMIAAVYRARETLDTRIICPRLVISKVDEKAESVLSRMGCNGFAPSVGGWRSLTPSDLAVYTMIAEVYAANGNVTDRALSLLRKHPAWPAISFLSKYQERPACRFLAEMIDPRWHVDPDWPNSWERLRRFVGFKDVLQATGLTCRALTTLQSCYKTEKAPFPESRNAHLNRTALALATWYGGCVMDGAALRKRLVVYLRRPGAFLLRYLYSKEHDDSFDVRFVRTMHRFLRFLKFAWLQNTYPSQREYQSKGGQPVLRPPKGKGYTRDVFCPEYFFETDEECAAWRRHFTKLRNQPVGTP